MKKLSFFNHAIYLSMFLLVVFTACQKEEQTNQVDFQPQMPVAKTHEAKVMQQTTNVIVSMLAENPELFSTIDESIKSDAVEYMEDRILFADLFKNPQFAKSNVSQTNPVSFASEFRKHATANIQYAIAETRATTLDADALMQYLVNNNISIYCPFPLEYYQEDNRIPAIAANIGEEYEELPGVQFHADGTYDSVMVSQAYADLHPVWLINPEEDYIFEDINARNKVHTQKQNVVVVPGVTWPITNYHYEISFPSVYITNYMGTLAGGDLNIRICRSTQNPTYNENEKKFMGTFEDITPYNIPRKYVYNAKKGYDKGWYDLQGFVFEQDWKADEYQHYIAVYEHDDKAVVNDTLSTVFQYDSNDGITLTVNAGITISYKSAEEIMAQKRLERPWIFDLTNNKANDVGSWTDEDGVKHYTDLNGYYLMRLSGDLLFSVRKRSYTD